jgi:hypothetical protein
MPSTRQNRAAPESPKLQGKTQPRLQRALETYGLILGVTVELLSEVGFERLSTSLVAAQP